MSQQSRRQFLQHSLLAASGTVLAACGVGTSLAQPSTVTRTEGERKRPVTNVDPRRGTLSCDNSQVSISPIANRLSRVEDFQQSACRMTRDSFEGPYFFCIHPTAQRIAQGKSGSPLYIALRAQDENCQAIANATIDVWHCDAHGVYSGYPADLQNAPMHHLEPNEQAVFCRGSLKTDADGIAEFITVYPSYYVGRAIHIHFKAHIGNRSYVTNQAYFSEAWNDRIMQQAPYNQPRSARRIRNQEERFGGIAEMRMLTRNKKLLAVLPLAFPVGA